MTALHLDTHVIVWLYIERHDKIPASTRARLATDPLRHSPIARLELAYLHGIGRLTDPAAQVLGELGSADEMIRRHLPEHTLWD